MLRVLKMSTQQGGPPVHLKGVGAGSSVWESSTDGLLIASFQQGGRGGLLAPSLGELEGLRRLPWVVGVTGSESRFRFSTGQGRVYWWTKRRRS